VGQFRTLSYPERDIYRARATYGNEYKAESLDGIAAGQVIGLPLRIGPINASRHLLVTQINYDC
jgi:hypothetical protein